MAVYKHGCALVSKHGCALLHAAEKLRGDREIVMQAVSNFAISLEDAAEELKGDREIVMKAVSQDGFALRYATEKLRGEAGMIETALANRQGSAMVALRVALLLWQVLHSDRQRGYGGESTCASRMCNVVGIFVSFDRVSP